jgi:hypothetical protein
MGTNEMLAVLLTLLASVVAVATASLELAKAALELRRAQLARRDATTAAGDATTTNAEGEQPTPRCDTLSRRRRKHPRADRGVGSTTTRSGWYRWAHLSGSPYIRYSGGDDRKM